MRDIKVKSILKTLEKVIVFHLVFLLFMSLNSQVVLASTITTDTFKPILAIIYVVLKVAGAVIALIGFAKLVLSFTSEQPESRFGSSMQLITGVALFFSEGILATLGIAL